MKKLYLFVAILIFTIFIIACNDFSNTIKNNKNSKVNNSITALQKIALIHNNQNIEMDTTVDFQSVYVGAKYNPDKMMTIKNTGQGILKLTGEPIIQINGTDKDNFRISQSSIIPSLSANKETAFFIQFNPLSAGRKTAVIKIYNSDKENQIYTFCVTGEGLVLNLKKGLLDIYRDSTVDLDNVNEGWSGENELFIMENTGPEVLTIYSIDLTNDKEKLFDLTIPVLPIDVGSGKNCIFKIKFNPKSYGDQKKQGLVTAGLEIRYNRPVVNSFKIDIKARINKKISGSTTIKKSQNYTPPQLNNLTATLILVAGGGGGGIGYKTSSTTAYAGGGGGAGEAKKFYNVPLHPNTAYKIIIGKGGNKATNIIKAANGGNSSFTGGTLEYMVRGGGAGGNASSTKGGLPGSSYDIGAKANGDGILGGRNHIMSDQYGEQNSGSGGGAVHVFPFPPMPLFACDGICIIEYIGYENNRN